MHRAIRRRAGVPTALQAAVLVIVVLVIVVLVIAVRGASVVREVLRAGSVQAGLSDRVVPTVAGSQVGSRAGQVAAAVRRAT